MSQGGTRGRGRGGPPRGGASPLSGGRGESPSRGSLGPGGRGGQGRGRGGGGGGDHFERGGGFRGGAPRGRGGPGGPGFGGQPAGSLIYKENIPATIPDRLSDQNLGQLIKSLGRLSMGSEASGPERPPRPGYGTLGTPIMLRANFHAVRLPKNAVYYAYVVDIQGKRSNIREVRSRIFQLLEDSPQCRRYKSHIAHDRTQRLVSAKELPQPLTVQIQFYEEGESGPGSNATPYEVAIRFERTLDMKDVDRYTDASPDARDLDLAPYLSALQLILQSYPDKNGIRVGRGDGRSVIKYFYDSPTRPFTLSPLLQAWQGFSVSVRPAFKQLMVNVNVCMAAFVSPGNLADILFEFNRNSRGAMPSLPRKVAKSIVVRTTHNNRKKKIYDIMTTPARNTFFEPKTGQKKISVEQYFKSTYNITLEFAHNLPVIDIGGPGRRVYVPAELCEVVKGCVFRDRLSGDETAAMIRVACNPPAQNARAITGNGFDLLGYNPPAPASPLAGFGITIDPEMAVIPGRELLPPGLAYKTGRVSVVNGSWNIVNVKFHRGAVVNSWGVLVVRDGRGTIQGPTDPNLKSIVEGFANKCRNSGMQIPNGLPALLPVTLFPEDGDPGRTRSLNEIRKVLQGAMQKGRKPTFILVLLEKIDNFIYPGLKKIGDVELGVHTLCMQVEKALGDPRKKGDPVKKQDQYFSNVALKLNTKLGGINHQLDDGAMKWLKKKSTMMVGIDVTHAGPTSRAGVPSIVAVVANTDASFSQFPASLRIQKVDPNKESKEMVDELLDMMVERLLAYEKKQSKLPERVFIFRDGVSEGQFNKVLELELPQVLKAFKKLETQKRITYRPQLSVVICGFFPTNSQFADRNGNTRPGTVVDKGVTAVFDFDFYLQSHAGLQGTVKATHYTVIYDENRFGADEIQKGTHDMNHLYVRATKAVSLIPPAYYADLACERGRCYLNDWLFSDEDRSAKGSKKGKGSKEEKDAVFDEAERAWGNGLHPDMHGSMFYI